MKKFKHLFAAAIALFVFTGCQSSSTEAPENEDVVQEQATNALGIIGAMSEEVEILKAEMEISEEVVIAGMTFYVGTLYDKDIVLVQSGVGKVNMAACTQILIDEFGVAALLNTGVAGTFDPSLDQGDIVISTEAVQHDFDTTAVGGSLGEISRLGITYFEADQPLIDTALEAAGNVTDLQVTTGLVASGDQFVAGGDLATRIKDHFGEVPAVEMEGAAMAHVAYLNEVPFVIIRSISDKADGEADLSYEEFLPLAAKNSSDFVLEFVQAYE